MTTLRTPSYATRLRRSSRAFRRFLGNIRPRSRRPIRSRRSPRQNSESRIQWRLESESSAEQTSWPSDQGYTSNHIPLIRVESRKPRKKYEHDHCGAARSERSSDACLVDLRTIYLGYSADAFVLVY